MLQKFIKWYQIWHSARDLMIGDALIFFCFHEFTIQVMPTVQNEFEPNKLSEFGSRNGTKKPMQI